jgi:hypothetical protein
MNTLPANTKDTIEMEDAETTKVAINNINVNEARDNMMPESLRGFSDDELKIMEKKLVRKADLVIM